jgi:hypothetical protein
MKLERTLVPLALLTVTLSVGCSEGPSWEESQLHLCGSQEVLFRTIHPVSHSDLDPCQAFADRRDQVEHYVCCAHLAARVDGDRIRLQSFEVGIQALRMGRGELNPEEVGFAHEGVSHLLPRIPVIETLCQRGEWSELRTDLDAMYAQVGEEGAARQAQCEDVGYRSYRPAAELPAVEGPADEANAEEAPAPSAAPEAQ